MARSKVDGPREFPETQEKDALRIKDGHLLNELAAKKRRGLRYLGLAGEEATDVLRWKQSLAHVVVVERPIADDNARAEFEDAIQFRLTPVFNGNIHIVYEDVWKHLCSDSFAKSQLAPDVVNLDFCGGLLYATDLEYPKQREAFQGLFERLQKTSEDFLLFLTLMPRDKGKETYKKYLKDQCESLKLVKDVDPDALAANFEFHAQSNLLLFKACLPLLIHDIGRSYNYAVELRLLRRYTKMLHLAFSCVFQPQTLGLASSPLFARKVLEAPLRRMLGNGREERETPPGIRG